MLQPTPMRPLEPGWRMLNQNFSQSFLPWGAMGRNNDNYNAMINLPGEANYAKSKEFASRWPGPKAENPALAMYFAPHTESSAIMTSDWNARGYFGGEWEGGTYTKTLIDHTLWWVNKWVEEGGLQGLYHDQFAPHTVPSISSGLAYLLPDGRVQPGYALTTRRQYVMRQHALWLEKGYARPRTLTHTTNGGPMGSYGWIESCIDGEDKQINSASTIDFADCWPSERIRAGTLTYNFGCVMGWMRLIDRTGMTDAQSRRHDRVFAGHCLLHDIQNTINTVYNWDRTPAKSPLYAFGMHVDDVFFWPFWRNGDVVKGQTAELTVSAWTRPDRALVCVFNYDRQAAAEAKLALDLKAMGVALPAGAAAWDIETPEAAVPAELTSAAAGLQVAVPARDFRLISIGAR
ncbi:MAG: hypothetical protein BWZ02_03069 [Lentisphaerae bacterium ADurb.BinA184]|nr:MAG: hypothetical protein BWZ02_03069 [Lentisphaerae bacterium ADurb.BinA184]